MSNPLVVIGAPTNIGIKPYDDGRARRLDLSPAVLREQRLVARLGARDAGDVAPPPYRDFVRPSNATRNEPEVAQYTRDLADRIERVIRDAGFPVVLGGDCSIVLAGLLGARQAGRSPVGLIYVDAHGDFATPRESVTGSAASMCLTLAVGRGESTLARLEGNTPLVDSRDVVIVGRRDDDEPYYGQDAMRALPILDIPDATVRSQSVEHTARQALERVTRPELQGFWVHIDADAIDPRDVPAVDSPTPGGLRAGDMAELLRILVRHPQALGLELTIYDPELDPDRSSAATLADMLERSLGSRVSASS